MYIERVGTLILQSKCMRTRTMTECNVVTLIYLNYIDERMHIYIYIYIYDTAIIYIMHLQLCILGTMHIIYIIYLLVVGLDDDGSVGTLSMACM